MTPFTIALMKYGLKEIAGKQDNPQIIQMFNDLGFNGKALKDETAWCSLFVNWCCKVAGYQYTGRLDAHSWENFKGVKEVEKPELGDIVVFWRGDYDGDPISGTDIPKRHVAFFVNFDPNMPNKYINCLGGNQSNTAQISKYYHSRVKGYYRPILQASL